MIRVANVIEDARLCGPQIRIANVACAMRKQIHTTVIMPRVDSERFREKLDSCNINYKMFKLSRITKDFRVALRYVFLSSVELFHLVRYLKHKNFDIVHVSGGSWQYKGAIAGRLAGIKVIWHLNDTYVPSFFRRLFATMAGLADIYVFASEKSKLYYAPLISRNKPQIVIPAPVDPSHFSPDNLCSGEVFTNQKWAGKTIVGIVGNINRIKGIDTFIRAASEVAKKNQNVHFIVVGAVFDSQNEYYKRLEKLVSDLNLVDISFVGGQDDIRPWLNLFDIYVCSSVAESSPISVWEAMSMAKPIVSTNVGDVPLYIKNGVSGDIVDVGNYHEMANKINDLIASHSKRVEYGNLAREEVKNRLSLEFCVEKHINVYKMAINQN